MVALNARLRAVGQDLWMKMFKIVDVDGSGRISYEEFESMVRKYLRVPPSKLSQQELQGLCRYMFAIL